MIEVEDFIAVNWCRAHFGRLKEGGTWAVPRSGLVFTRTGDSLTLTKIQPHADPAYQQEDFETLRNHFAAAGIDIHRLTP